MTPKTAEDYGGGQAILDQEPVEDPRGQLSADHYKRLTEDVAQMSRVVPRAILVWKTKGSGVVGTPVRTRTAWGDTLSYAPTIARTGAGLYTLTYPASFVDGLSVSESISWFAGFTLCDASETAPNIGTTIVGPVVTIKIWNNANAASDLTPDVAELSTYLF